MQPVDRQSLTTTLDIRYAKQHAGMAFDVKQILGGPGSVPAAGTTIDAVSQNANMFQSPIGFEVKPMIGITQLKDAQGVRSKELSTYIKGFSSVKYRP